MGGVEYTPKPRLLDGHPSGHYRPQVMSETPLEWTFAFAFRSFFTSDTGYELLTTPTPTPTEALQEMNYDAKREWHSIPHPIHEHQRQQVSVGMHTAVQHGFQAIAEYGLQPEMWQHLNFWPAWPTLVPTHSCFSFETHNIPPTFPSKIVHKNAATDARAKGVPGATAH
jgi:hypothetical protein